LNKKLNILICPLEWGLGHAARMVPVARMLKAMNHNIFVGSGEEHITFFRNEIPGLTYIKFPGVNPRYSRYLPQYISLLLKTPSLLYHIILEHHRLKKIIREHSIDLVISDNRFGLWNRKVTTVYVTHMPRIPFPKRMRFLEFIGIFLHRKIIKKYSFCFIPDLPGTINVSGRLSHGMKLPANVRYIGLLSRFQTEADQDRNIQRTQQNLVILSGPEPQREIFKQKLIMLFKGKDQATVILGGQPSKNDDVVKTGNITFYNHLPSAEMKNLIESSQNIISRSGYTTVMELISLNCSALLVPTPGQTEQEYLAEYLLGKGWFSTIAQSELKNGTTLPTVRAVGTIELTEQSNVLFINALRELLEYSHKNRKADEPGQKT
jgi:predicted glycosyltransferase